MIRKGIFDASGRDVVLALAESAGAILMLHYGQGLEVITKSDASPVTLADQEADAHIVAGLKRLTPDIPVVSEEGAHDATQGAEAFWLVDPLDGTKSFVRGSGCFTVNIALLARAGAGAYAPVFGVIYDPRAALLYWGDGAGASQRAGDVCTAIRCRPAPRTGLVALTSSEHPGAKMRSYLDTQSLARHEAHSSSIKFCLLAAGHADLYPRFTPTMEWDTAAGHAILLAAGGTMLTDTGKPFLYGKPGFRNGGFIARGVA